MALKSSSKKKVRRGTTTGKRKTGRKFKYHHRSMESVEKRQEQLAKGHFETYFKPEYKMFKPANGKNRIRILPPTWSDNADHYGMDLFVHYGIGADNVPILCPKKMHNKKCVICEARERAKAEGDDDYAKELGWSRRVLVWMVDRKNPDEGAQLWAMPAQKVDKSIIDQSVDEDTGEMLVPDDPDEGYDILFTKEGERLGTEYVGVTFARKATPLGDDAEELLEYITEHPLNEVLLHKSQAEIRALFEGESEKEDEEEEDEEEEDEEDEEEDEWEEDEEDEEEDEWEEEDEEEPEEDEEWEEEEEEEEEPPRRRKRTPSKRKATGKKSSAKKKARGMRSRRK